MVAGDLSLTDLAMAAKRDRGAPLTTLLARLRPGLVAAVRASSIHPNDREDAVQDVLILVMRCVDLFDISQGDFSPYVMTSVRLHLKKIKSNAGEHHNRYEVLGDESESVAAVADGGGDADDLDSLPVLHRDVIRDHYGLGLPRSYNLNQIAARRGISGSQVRAILKEGLAVMRRRSV